MLLVRGARPNPGSLLNLNLVWVFSVVFVFKIWYLDLVLINLNLNLVLEYHLSRLGFVWGTMHDCSGTRVPVPSYTCLHRYILNFTPVVPVRYARTQVPTCTSGWKPAVRSGDGALRTAVYLLGTAVCTWVLNLNLVRPYLQASCAGTVDLRLYDLLWPERL
eukprot:SAG31_NODE_15929_length_731_cov_0.802215_1_plen_162_part_00